LLEPLDEPVAPEETPPRSEPVELVPELLDPDGFEPDELLSCVVDLPDETPPRSEAVELVPELLEPETSEELVVPFTPLEPELLASDGLDVLLEP
jgi:hypothetical protein